MKNVLWLLILYIPIITKAQQTDTITKGINFLHDIHWKKLVQQAKRENKYIFIDCFTTWCGACKMMEKDVFCKEDVGVYFNKYFLCVKLKMDKNIENNRHARNNNLMAKFINNEYGVPVYPTFLFFSSNGELVSRASGYLSPSHLIGEGNKAMLPGTRAAYQVFYSRLSKYQQGIKDFGTMAGIADTAKQIGQYDIAEAIAKEYRPYLLGLNMNEWYKRTNLSFIANFVKGSSDPFFSIFYKNSFLVDSVLGKAGFSQYVVDKIIQVEEIDPMLKSPIGMQLSTQETSNIIEPDWEIMWKQIAQKYSEVHAERNILFARAKWYQDHSEWLQCALYFNMYVKKYPFLFIDDRIASFINTICWAAIFQRSVDKDQIDGAISCMSNVVKKFPNWTAAIDTYANLLYKAGRITEAIQQEERALVVRPEEKVYIENLNRMKEGKPTWPCYISNSIFDSGKID